MTRVQVDVDEASGQEAPGVDAEGAGPDASAPRGKRRRPDLGPEVEIEREITKRHLIEAVSSVVVVILYMIFTLMRDRDAGVVVLDEKDAGPADDWEEA